MSHSCFRIYDNNFVSLELLANQDYSSQQSAFPASNIYNIQRRTKVWRSNGYYNVTSSNNTIIFRESTGVDITATIAIAEYTSTSSFLTAVQAALNAAGSSVYTVNQDNIRFKFTSNGSGGGGIFELRCADASFTAYDLLGFAQTNRTGALNYTADFLRIHYAKEFLLWDFGISSNPSAFFLIGLRNSPLPYTNGATIKLEANETNNFSSPSFSTTLTYDDEVILKLTDTGIATQAYRYWRLSFEDQRNGLGYIQVSNVFLGDYFDPARGRAQFPLQAIYEDLSTVNSSEGGQILPTTREQTARFNVNMFGLQKADIEYFDSLYESYGKSIPLFISMDSSAAFSSTANRRVIFARFENNPQWELVAPDTFNLTLAFREDL